MADLKISALTGASIPLTGTEVLPVVQSGGTVKVSVANLTAGRTVATGQLTTSVTGATDKIAQFNGENANNYISIYDGSGTGATFGSINGGNPYIFGGTGKSISFYAGAAEKVRVSDTGNIVIVNAAKGVNFTANTPAAGMTSQLLNWYEEGTFTPSFSAATGGAIASTGAATYTRTGRQVVVRGYVFTTNVSLVGKSGQVSISGLPFTASGDSLVSATALYVAGSYNAPLAFVSCGTVAGTLIGLQKPYLTTAVQPFATTDLNTTGNANLVYFNATYFI